MNQYKNIKENIKIGQEAIKNLEAQMENMNNIFSETVRKLNGEDRQKIQTLQAKINRVIAKAKKGEDIEKEINKIKETFKKDISNGGKDNR